MASIFATESGPRLRRRRILCAVALAAATLASTTSADAGFFEDAFGETAAGGVACYVRSYDAAHLRSNPRQRVTFIAVKAPARKQDGNANRSNDFELVIGLRVRNRQDLYAKTAYCKADSRAARCGLESDGGDIRLQASTDGSLRVDTAGGEIRIEGERDFLEVGGRVSDDNVFRLGRARPDACAGLD